MRHIISTCVLSLAIAGSTCAQTPHKSDELSSPKWTGTVVCHNEKAMLTLMHTLTPNLGVNRNVLVRLLLSGDCMMLPEDWRSVTIQNPPRDQLDSHAAKVTVQTPDGAVLHVWSAPIAED